MATFSSRGLGDVFLECRWLAGCFRGTRPVPADVGPDTVSGKPRRRSQGLGTWKASSVQVVEVMLELKPPVREAMSASTRFRPKFQNKVWKSAGENLDVWPEVRCLAARPNRCQEPVLASDSPERLQP